MICKKIGKVVEAQSNRVCFVINHKAFFVSHRLPLAIGALNSGYSVSVLTGHAGSVEMEAVADRVLVDYPIGCRRVSFRSSSVNPVFEAIGLFQLVTNLRELKPSIVHCASPKGVLYGGIAARLAGVSSLVLAVSGMGYAFTQGIRSSIPRRIIGFVYKFFARFAFGHRNIRVIVQNQDDLNGIVTSGLVKRENVALIPGSGVDLSDFPETLLGRKAKIVLFPARVLYDKGALEFFQAAEKIRKIRDDWRFIIAGAAGYDNPSAVSEEEVRNWRKQGTVEWLGHVDDMPGIFLKSAIVCLPSYREGMPKSLLEAAAAGCAIVTTDVIGCREAIAPGVTGDLVPVRDSDVLAEVILRLMDDEGRCSAYGKKGRKRAEQLFSVTSVVDSTLRIYEDLINNDKCKNSHK